MVKWMPKATPFARMHGDKKRGWMDVNLNPSKGGISPFLIWYFEIKI